MIAIVDLVRELETTRHQPLEHKIWIIFSLDVSQPLHVSRAIVSEHILTPTRIVHEGVV